ncbi:unnamed protein product [Protopolystoma xenopodis]|uniref:Uncharacterized protein n=1 Tax=Protopolystoma xenopodis TaxID=117903 RepID=A0A448XHV7_9PLAT|nr:unnamed protein product [Protopolystoma xenopodis]
MNLLQHSCYTPRPAFHSLLTLLRSFAHSLSTPFRSSFPPPSNIFSHSILPLSPGPVSHLLRHSCYTPTPTFHSLFTLLRSFAHSLSTLFRSSFPPPSNIFSHSILPLSPGPVSHLLRHSCYTPTPTFHSLFTLLRSFAHSLSTLFRSSFPPPSNLFSHSFLPISFSLPILTLSRLNSTRLLESSPLLKRLSGPSVGSKIATRLDSTCWCNMLTPLPFVTDCINAAIGLRDSIKSASRHLRNRVVQFSSQHCKSRLLNCPHISFNKKPVCSTRSLLLCAKQSSTANRWEHKNVIWDDRGLSQKSLTSMAMLLNGIVLPFDANEPE